jgi:molybdenum cofactor biosynthesis enzyme MoaA
MKANNLTISISAPCRKNCPYCISNMTFHPKTNDDLFQRNLEKAVNMAHIYGVNSVLITSKGEPLLRLEYVKNVAECFKAFPLEIQTNGDMLIGMGVLDMLYYSGVNTIAISVDSMAGIKTLEPVYSMIVGNGFNLRLTIVISDLWEEKDIRPVLDYCVLNGIRQLTFRLVTIPEIYRTDERSQATIKWIEENTKRSQKEFFDSIDPFINDDNSLIRELPFGPKVYSAMGVAITTIPYCIQEHNNTQDIRSLIYHQDGHVYTSWDKPASILF